MAVVFDNHVVARADEGVSVSGVDGGGFVGAAFATGLLVWGGSVSSLRSCLCFRHCLCRLFCLLYGFFGFGFISLGERDEVVGVDGDNGAILSAARFRLVECVAAIGL
jgi:hypothetical protein